MLWYPEKLSALWTKFINTKQKSGPVNELLENLQESERNEPNVTSFRSRGTTAWWFKTLAQSNQFWWESLHMKEREISVTKRGYTIFFNKRLVYCAKIKIEFYVNYEQFKDTLVMFQPSQNWCVMHWSLAIWKGTYFIEDFHGTSSPYWKWIDSGRKGEDKARQVV